MKKQELIAENTALKTELTELRRRLTTLEERLAWATEIGCKAIESQQAWQAAYYRDVPGAKQAATVPTEATV